MKLKNKVFFATEKEMGITQTSANHIANMAKEFVQKINEDLDSINLVTSKVELLSSTGDAKILKQEINVDKFKAVMETSMKIIHYNSLIAWLREAIKAKEDELNEVSRTTFSTWAELTNNKIPDRPTTSSFGTTTFEDELGKLSIKERNNYLALETQCAVLGKLIHPDGALSKARKEFQKRLSNQRDINGSGRDATIITYISSLLPEEVEDVFFKLQAKHREAQAQFNKIKFELEQTVTNTNAKANHDYSNALSAFGDRMDVLNTQYANWLAARRDEVSKLKIAIPESLGTTFAELNNIGK